MVLQEISKHTHPAEGVIYIIHSSDGKFLLTKRIKQDSNFYGEFLFPAGRIEPEDISELHALRREVKEERGVEVNKAIKISSITYPHPNGNDITQHIFLVDSKDIIGEIGNLEPEKEELYWTTLDEARSLCTFSGALMVVDELDKYLTTGTGSKVG